MKKMLYNNNKINNNWNATRYDTLENVSKS